MKYKDYYKILDVARDASDNDIKKAYRKLARRYHPDVSKEAGAEDKFKEVSEAYETLRDKDKRAAFDQLGSHRQGQDFRPPPDWASQFGAGGNVSFEDIDLSDLFASMAGGAARGPHAGPRMQIRGQDFEVLVHLNLDEAMHGTEVTLNLEVPEYDAQGVPHRVPRTIQARIPKGATHGRKLRLSGKGGPGFNGGPAGDLYLNIELHPHPLFRVDGHDLYLDLPLAPWEVALGCSVKVPTLAGAVQLKVPPGTPAGQRMRMKGRGLPKPGGGHGDLFALVQVVMPTVIDEREKELFRKLAETSSFNPRGHFEQEVGHAH